MLLCAGVLFYAKEAVAFSYHSFAYGYSLSLPDDWTQIPEEQLAVKITELSAIHSGGGRFDVAFQPKRNSHWLEYPFILVEVIPYSVMGYAQQVNNDQITQIIRTNTGMDPTIPYKPDTQIMEGGAESDNLENFLNVDRPNHRYVWSSTGKVPEMGLVRRNQWGYFGKESLVQITLYEQGMGSDRLRDLARVISGSFKHEIGRDFQMGLTLADVTRATGGMFSNPNMGLLVTIGCVGIGVVCAIYSIASNRRKALEFKQHKPSIE